MNVKQILIDGSSNEKSLQKVGNELGVTRERVRQLYEEYEVPRRNLKGKGIFKDPTITTDISDMNLMWLAGLWEGEGCFSNRGGGISTQIRMTDKDVLEGMISILGGKIVAEVKKEPHHSTSYAVAYNGLNAALLMGILYPHLYERRRQSIEQIVINSSRYFTDNRVKLHFCRDFTNFIDKTLKAD